MMRLLGLLLLTLTLGMMRVVMMVTLTLGMMRRVLMKEPVRIIRKMRVMVMIERVGMMMMVLSML